MSQMCVAACVITACAENSCGSGARRSSPLTLMEMEYAMMKIGMTMIQMNHRTLMVTE